MYIFIKVYLHIWILHLCWILCCILCYSSCHLDWFSHFIVLYSVSLCFFWVWQSKSACQVQVKQVKEVQQCNSERRGNVEHLLWKTAATAANITSKTSPRFVSQFFLTVECACKIPCMSIPFRHRNRRKSDTKTANTYIRNIYIYIYISIDLL